MSMQRPGLRRFREAGSGRSAVQIEAARIAARRGNREEARQLLRLAAEADPGCVEAWLGLAWLSEVSSERRALLHRVLALEPGNVRAKAELARMQPEPAQPEADTVKGGQAGEGPPRQAASAVGPEGTPGPTAGAKREPARGREGEAGKAPTPPRVDGPESAPAPAKAGRAQEAPAPRRRRRGRAAIQWIAIGCAAVLVAAVALLAWGPLSNSLASLLPTPTPTPVPTPLPGPGEIAGRFVPQLESALLDTAWDRAVELVAIMQSIAPTDPAVTDWACRVHLQWGQALVWDGQMAGGLAQFDLALQAKPGDAEAARWRSATQAYLAGRQALQAGEWESAVAAFLLVPTQIPGYGDAAARLLEAYQGLGKASMAASDWTKAIDALAEVRKLNPSAPELADSLQLCYRERGIAREKEDQLAEARADLEAALALAPGDTVAKKHLDQVLYKLFPPKRIEIDISEQRMSIYEGQKLLYKWVISTGLPGQDTATGHYEVLDKIPMAYSSLWRLKMPYWLGIYYIGRVENGIHALPIRPDGSVMWAGLLGQRASYGCVILDNTAAPILYKWAEVGTKVDIHN